MVNSDPGIHCGIKMYDMRYYICTQVMGTSKE